MHELEEEIDKFCVSIGQLEEEKEELQRLLTNEKSARQLQEKINEEQQRFQQHLHEESQKTSSEKVNICPYIHVTFSVFRFCNKLGSYSQDNDNFLNRYAENRRNFLVK